MKIEAVYFIGIGGIGMSAIARYFLHKGVNVGGYDKTPTDLTRKLEAEGASIHYEENVNLISAPFRNPETCLVVYTPAIPEKHAEWMYFLEHGFTVQKRAQVLGSLTRFHKGLCVAGTHGKTTTSSMAAHLLHQSTVDCHAFLGGITKNYGSNYILADNSDYVVIEADEFDRSFHWLSPFATVITSADPDHLDIYGTKEAYLESFRKYTSLVVPGGYLIVHEGLELQPDPREGVKVYSYGRESGDFHAENIRIGGGEIVFDLVSPIESIQNIQLGVPVSINIDNGIAAMALAQVAGVSCDEIRNAMATFRGVDRRFDFYIKNVRGAFLTDYAHHPEEIRKSALSIRELYAGKKIMAVFQPHLYSRTRDFYQEFADSLSLFDEVLLTEIYPARELPIPGVSSNLIYDRLSYGVEKKMCKKEELTECIAASNADVVVVLGAGDIESYAPQIKEVLEKKW